MEDIKQTNDSVNLTSSEDKKATKSKKPNKIVVIIFSVLVAIMVLVMLTNDNEPKYQTFGDISFSAPGEWKIKEENNDPIGDWKAHTTVVSNGSYEVTIIDMKSEVDITPEISDTVISQFIKELPNPQDVCMAEKGTLNYAGGWFENEKTINSDVEAGYAIMNSSDDSYTVVSISGDQTTKDDVIASYKSVKYKNTYLYEN